MIVSLKARQKWERCLQRCVRADLAGNASHVNIKELPCLVWARLGTYSGGPLKVVSANRCRILVQKLIALLLRPIVKIIRNVGIRSIDLLGHPDVVGLQVTNPESETTWRCVPKPTRIKRQSRLTSHREAKGVEWGQKNVLAVSGRSIARHDQMSTSTALIRGH